MKNRSLNPLHSAAMQSWLFMCACVAGLRRSAFAMCALFALAVGFFAPAKAHAALVSYDGTNITWTPADLLTPLTNAITTAVAAAVVIFVIVVGVRWVMRMVKGAK